MAIERLRLRPSLDDERLRSLEQLVPEAFAEGVINWEVLRELLGERIEDENASTEHFGLFWPGKRDARRLAAQPSKGTLVPALGKGMDEETTGNIFIEGDNLEVLKLLQKSYTGRIKMIYIDPPYNTGNDFIYKDNFVESLEDYLKKTGQIGEEGELLTTNTKDNGRFHSNWLNMMYPRLRLARNLLRDDGMIFVSIDDNEVHNLRLMMNEVFGEENFLANIAWEKRYTRSNNAKLFYSLKDSILVYRNSEMVAYLREARTDKSDSIYSNPDNDPRGAWTSSSYVNPATKQERPNLVYTINNPFTKEEVNHPTHAWKYSVDEHKRHIEENRLWWGKDGTAVYPRLKNFLTDSDGLVPIDLWSHETSGTTDEGGAQVKELFNEAVFDNPKPTKLIQRMLKLVTSADEDALILDFFVGSGSTAQAVMEVNGSDHGNRKFLCVQLPEKIHSSKTAFKAGYNTIAELCEERIRRAAKQIKSTNSEKLAMDSFELDTGFKVFKLDRSNFQAWEDYRDNDIRQLEILFASHETPFIEGWKEQDVLIELLLIEGFPLNSKITLENTFTANRVLEVKSDFSAHRLFICLEPHINDQTIERVAKLPSEDIFICIDSAVTDTAKLRLNDLGNVRTI